MTAKKLLIVGGNSGIGLESARQLTAAGHEVVLLGRSQRKGEQALASLRGRPGAASFLAVDVSTHAGVREAAAKVSAEHGRLDGILHTSGVLTFDDVRTADGLHPFFAVNFLSRYHLTQRLLPLLRQSGSGCVVMVTSKVPLDTRFDFERFPHYRPWQFRELTMRIQIGNHHYASYLRDTEQGIRAGVINAGVVKTGIWRSTPFYVRLGTAILGPLLMDSVRKAAVNPVAACTRETWSSGSWWAKVGAPDRITPLELDRAETRRVIERCAELVGA